MAKLLLEYKGIPAILTHNFKKVDKTTFINVYTTGQNDYIRKDFKDLESAIDFEPENATLKITFVYLESEEDGTNYVQYQTISLTNNKLILSGIVDIIHKGFKFSVDFGLETFRLKKIKSYTTSSTIAQYEISYVRRKTNKTGTGKTYDLLDSYYELFPRYEDIFLETLFMLDLMTTNFNVSSKDELEAYFLQAKFKAEKNKKPKKDKLDSDDTSEESEEQLELSNLIGLDEIKLEIQELKALAQFRKKRLELGLPVTPSTLHLVFTGNPGTGKTTVARMLGQIYYDIGLLASSKVIEASRGDLVGQYVGHTAPKTQKIFESALGGILFIDEAYSLFKSGSGNDFGMEAVETLLKLMEDNRENIVVIIAGYPKEIEDLLNSNPGLKSRFSKTLHFADYSKDELIQIFYKLVADYHNSLSDGAKYKIEYLIEKYYEDGLFNSNARAIRNIFEETIKRQSHRLSSKEDTTQDEMTSFIDKDIPDELK